MYDMCRAITLLEKLGGKSGHWRTTRVFAACFNIAEMQNA